MIQNRISAQKFRAKKKEYLYTLEQEMNVIKDKYKMLTEILDTTLCPLCKATVSNKMGTGPPVN